MSMSPENINTAKHNGQSTGSQKRLSEQGLRCPRCDSANTKFCYYNNYNLSQPRHFCKTCRRYWTKGGALRNVPIGGGCRKNKKSRSSSRSSGNMNTSNSSESNSELGGFKFFQGISLAMDFQLGGVSNFPKAYNLHLPSYNSVISNTSPCFDFETLGGSVSSPQMGLNFPLPNVMKHGESSGYGLEQHEHQMGISMNVQSNFASSIESLSSINQELHWKLQQERLGLFSGVGKINQNEKSSSTIPMKGTDVEKPQPIMFQNQILANKDTFGLDEVRKGGGDEDIVTEWLFGTSYAPTSHQNPTDISSKGNEETNIWSDDQGWSKLNQYGAIP